jgi:hypothetical protein
MTYLQLEEVSSDDDLLARQIGPTVNAAGVLRLSGWTATNWRWQCASHVMTGCRLSFCARSKRRSRRPTPAIAKYVSPVPQRRKMPLPA